MAVPYVYPSDIQTDKYKYRHVMISVKESEIAADAKAAYDKAVSKLKDALNTVPNEVADVGSIAKNLEANSKASSGTTKAVIVLPLPNTFTDSQNHGWSNESGVIGSIGAKIANQSVTGIANKIAGAIPGRAGEMTQAITGAADSIAGDITIDKVLGSSAAAAGLRKPLIDPGYFQNYTGSNPREFTMSWDLVPNNAPEAASIMAIIMKLKEYASPTKMKGGLTLFAPYWMSVKFSNNYISAMAKMDRVVITNISVDYGADGFMQQTFDGQPKHMTLTLSFAEVDMTTADDYSTVPAK